MNLSRTDFGKILYQRARRTERHVMEARQHAAKLHAEATVRLNKAAAQVSRRSFLRGCGAVIAAAACLPLMQAVLPTYARALSLADYIGFVSVKDPRFGGAISGDWTVAIQACADYCFGSSGAPHGAVNASLNKLMYFPPGDYQITTRILFTSLAGARIIGGGRLSTSIFNNTAGGSVFVTNGCGYSHFEGMELVAFVSAKVFDLNWDNHDTGGSALQANTFVDMLFDGDRTTIGTAIGYGGFMGSETLFLNCHWTGNDIGVACGNFNALQQQIIGGNVQDNRIGITSGTGSIPVISGVGFQLNDFDIDINAAASNAMTVTGCRSESTGVFIRNSAGQGIDISGIQPTQNSDFLIQAGGLAYIRATSIIGKVTPTAWARLTIDTCQVSNPGGTVLSWLVLTAAQLWYTPNNNVSAYIVLRNTIIFDGNTLLGDYHNAAFFTTNGSTITQTGT